VSYAHEDRNFVVALVTMKEEYAAALEQRARYTNYRILDVLSATT